MNRQQEPTFRKMPGLTDTRSEQRYGQASAHLQHSVRHPSGYITLIDPTLNGGMPQSGETIMCVHCQFHFLIEPGSGMKRGWCGRCNGATCGKQGCETRCVPFEKAIELMEHAV